MSSVSYVSGCSCCCGGGLCVLCVMFAFLFLSVRLGDVLEAVGCKGRDPPPVLASLSSSVCLSLLLNVGK